MAKPKCQALQVTAALLLICSATVFAADNRELGTWRLRSQKIVEGSSAIPHFAAKTIMTVRQDTSGNFVVQVEPKQPQITDHAVKLEGEVFSPDGKRMTQTLSSGNPQYRIILIWDKQ
jgi:hypothetical protein